MTMFQVNLTGENKGHLFDTIAQAYAWVCNNVMTADDADFYQSIGNKVPLDQIQNENIQEVVLRNSFENVRFSGWNDRIDEKSPYFIFHKNAQ